VNKGVLREVDGVDSDRIFEVCEDQSALAGSDRFADRDDAESDAVTLYCWHVT
jgi:hypothetical protein